MMSQIKSVKLWDWLAQICQKEHNHLHHTAVSRKVVGRNVHVTIPKGNMGYDQYTVRND